MIKKQTSAIRKRALSDAAANKIKVIIAQSARIISLMFMSGTLIQTFLASIGFSSDLIYIHSSILQAFNTATIILFSGFANRGSPIKRSAFSILPTALLFLMYVPLAIGRSASWVSYILLTGVGVAQQISIGLCTVCEYKVPYYIYRVEEYGMMSAICGIISYALSLLIGALISKLSTVYDFVDIMTVSFIISAALTVVTFAATLKQKSLLSDKNNTPADEEKSKTSLLALLHYPVFSHLIAANLLRGFANGVITVLATVALDLGYNETLTASMVSVSAAATMVGCGAFAVISKRTNPALPIVIGSALVLSLPLLLINNSFLFLLIYAVLMFGRTFIDYGVPTMLIRIVPVEIAGSYNAWRMVLHQGGTFIATAVAAWLPIPVLLILAAIFQIISGISYLFFGKKMMGK